MIYIISTDTSKFALNSFKFTKYKFFASRLAGSLFYFYIAHCITNDQTILSSVPTLFLPLEKLPFKKHLCHQGFRNLKIIIKKFSCSLQSNFGIESNMKLTSSHFQELSFFVIVIVCVKIVVGSDKKG